MFGLKLNRMTVARSHYWTCKLKDVKPDTCMATNVNAGADNDERQLQ